MELPIANASLYTVSEAQARTAAENIYTSPLVLAQGRHNQQTGDTQRVFRGRQRILTFTAVTAADGQPGFYLCNYAHGGFSIIAADRHMQPFLVFAEYGSLPTHDLRNTQVLPEGLITWLENTKRVAAALRANPSKNNIEAGAAESWSSTETPICPDMGDGEPPTCDNQPTYTSTQVGPLLQTTWGQGCGYNDLTPASNRQAYCNHCPTGCVATAMAQIMNYWHYPSLFDWNNMHNNSGSPATAALMRTVGNSIYMDYNEDDSHTDDDYVDEKLKSHYRYSSADYISSEDPGLYQTVINNLNNNQPVMLGGYSGTSFGGLAPGGSGHSWVCDGYIQSYYNGNGYLSYHMNWGYEGRYNAWCAYNDWHYTDYGGTTHSYNYMTDIIINIHP